jgi:hypothetical protein
MTALTTKKIEIERLKLEVADLNEGLTIAYMQGAESVKAERDAAIADALALANEMQACGEETERVRKQRDRLRKALQPFANVAYLVDENNPDCDLAATIACNDLSTRHILNARAALEAAEAARKDVHTAHTPLWRQIEEIEKRLMAQLGFPNSASHKSAFDQFANELSRLLAASPAAPFAAPTAEWYRRAAEREGDQEVSAGICFDSPVSKQERDRLIASGALPATTEGGDRRSYEGGMRRAAEKIEDNDRGVSAEIARAAAYERGRHAGLREAAEIAKAYAQKWAEATKRAWSGVGEAFCESAASSGNELATAIEARIKEGQANGN